MSGIWIGILVGVILGGAIAAAATWYFTKPRTEEVLKQFNNELERTRAATEKEAEQILAKIEAAEDELYQLRKKFNSDIKSVISAKKIIKLRKAEENFRRKLLKQYRGSGPGNGKN